MKRHDPETPAQGRGPLRDNGIEGMITEARHQRDARIERAHEAEQRDARKQNARDVSTRRLFLLTPLLVLLVIANLILAKKGPGGFTTEDKITAGRLMIYMAVTAIEAYQDTAGVPPASLRQIDAASPDLRYELVGTSYKVTAYSGIHRIVYFKGDELASYAEVEEDPSVEVSP